MFETSGGNGQLKDVSNFKRCDSVVPFLYVFSIKHFTKNFERCHKCGRKIIMRTL